MKTRMTYYKFRHLTSRLFFSFLIIVTTPACLSKPDPNQENTKKEITEPNHFNDPAEATQARLPRDNHEPEPFYIPSPDFTKDDSPFLSEEFESSYSKSKTSQHLDHHIQDLINENKLQEAIWLLQESGDETESKELTDKLETILHSSKFVVKTEKLKGRTKKYILEFPSGIKFLFKPDPEFNDPNRWASCSNCEVAAYILDKALTMNLVPLTSIKSVQGHRGSAQYFIRGNLIPGAGTSTASYKKLKVFDYIAGNSDRHKDNWLYLTDEDRVIAIDHGISFRWMSYAYEDVLKGWLGIFPGTYIRADHHYQWDPSKENDISVFMENLDSVTQQKILRTSKATLKAALSPYMKPQDLKRLLTRFENVKHVIRGEYHQVVNTWIPRPF